VGYDSCLLIRSDLQKPLNGQAEDLNLMVAPAGPALDWLDRLECFGVLIRPDRYIFGAVRTEAELTDLIERFRAARHCFSLADPAAQRRAGALNQTVPNKDLP
jgi:hypothetical protein